MTNPSPTWMLLVLTACNGDLTLKFLTQENVPIVKFRASGERLYEIVIGSDETQYVVPDNIESNCVSQFELEHFTTVVWERLERFQNSTKWMGNTPRVDCTGSYRYNEQKLSKYENFNSLISIDMSRSSQEFTVVSFSHSKKCIGTLTSAEPIAARLALVGMMATTNCAAILDPNANEDTRSAIGVVSYGMFMGFGIETEYFGPLSASAAAQDITKNVMSSYRWWKVYDASTE